jgi:hypothetical protein
VIASTMIAVPIRRQAGIFQSRAEASPLSEKPNPYITATVKSNSMKNQKQTTTLRSTRSRVGDIAYLLLVLVMGIPCALADRLIMAPLTSLCFLPCRRAQLDPSGFYHATDKPFAHIDLAKGKGQLGHGLYLQIGFVSPCDRLALEARWSDFPEDWLDVPEWSWRYAASVGHYFVTALLPSRLIPSLNDVIDATVFPVDRIRAPEFGYPWGLRQVRLADSARNRSLLRSANFRWVAISSTGTVTPLTDPPPTPAEASPATPQEPRPRA